jgi:hypothetical protein
LIFLCVTLLITTSTWAYSDDCAKGPEYWCRDASTAEDCGAIQHCQQTVWREKENNIKPMTTGETAQMLCNVIVQASSELVAHGLVDFVSIKEYLRHDCTRLPYNNKLIQQCDKAVDLYLPDVLRHIESGTEMSKICPIIQGHDSQSAFIPQPKPIGITPNETCIVCEFIMFMLETFISSNSSAPEIAKALEEICQAMPDVLKAECKSFIDEYGADIVALLVREFSPNKTCEFIKLCPKPKNVAFLIKPNEHACGLCDYVSTYLSTGHPIENVCKHFSTDNNIKEQCEILVHLYKPNLCSQLPICIVGPIIQPLEQPMENTVNSAECSLCKYVIGYIDNIIQNNKSEAAIEAALEKVCTILPGPLKDKCTQFVETYGPVLVQLIEKYGTPELVCDALKLCKNGTQTLTPLERVQLMKFEKSLKSIPCLFCKYIIGYIDTAIGTNRSEAAIEAVLEKVCNIVPASLKNNCTAFVQKYGPIIAFLLARNATPVEVCNFIKLCNNGTQAATSSPSNPICNIEESEIKSAQCALCKYVVTYIDTVIQNNKSEAAIEAALKKVCGILPGPMKDKCDQFVQTYGPVLVQLIEKYGTPDQVCDALKLCNNGTQTLTPLERVQLMKREKSLKSIPCLFCKYIIGYIDTAIGTNRSAAAIEAVLEKVCNIVPASLKKNCTSFVQKYGPIIAFLLARNATPVEVCNFIKLCNNGTQAVTPSGTNSIFNIEGLSIKSAECALCKYVISYIDAVIQNNKSEAAIEAALEKVCGILPGPIKDKCDQFVQTYGPVLVQLIEKYGTPEQVCDALQLCHNGTQEITPNGLVQLLKITEPSIKSAECALCKYVVSYIDAVIQNNKSEAAIEAALEKVCGILPGPIKDKCDQFVETYGPVLVKLIEKYGTPDQVCDALKLCHNGTQVTESISHNIVESIKKIKDGNECTLCKYIISYLNVLIENNATVKDLEKALELVCIILPSQYHAKCKDFVDTYGPILAELIVELDDPNVVCVWLSLCPKTDNKFIEIPAVKTKKLKSLPCNLCEYVVNYLDAVLQSNATETQFEKALDKACKVFPSTKIQSNCELLVHLYGTDLIKFLVEFGDPKTVCQAVGICDK